jgi:hypothetical protein
MTCRFVIRDHTAQKLGDEHGDAVYFGVRKVNPLIDKSSFFVIAAEKV